MKQTLRSWMVGLALLAAGEVAVQAAATVSVQVDEPGAQVSSNLFGIFFEEINYGGEGGLYAELIRNRSFASSSSPADWFSVSTGSASGQMAIDTSSPLNTNNVRSLRLTKQSGNGSYGAGNSGYWGIALQAGAIHDLNLYARSANGFSGPLAVRLESSDGSTVYAQTSFTGLTANWQHFAASLVPSGSDTSARLVLAISSMDTVWLDEVSLFPRDTYAGRTNGLRMDLANKLADLSPSFYRYPGGNFIESWDVSNAVRWKKTVGDIAQRPGHLNDAWGYWSSDGYGLDEFFRQCEDMGMEPLYGINAGLMLGYDGSANNTVPMAEMGPWVQDAVDLIEYANGDTNTTWGALRAANGHPEPYGLKYLEIGNENGGSYYNERYTLFYDAIKAQYPEMRLIACGNWSGGPPWSRPLEIIDEHYYNTAAEMISFANKYDSYDRDGPKVFVGEYATLIWGNHSLDGSLLFALAEAVFMTGMERNSDIVEMACYAPLFGNVNGTQWNPDLIYFDNHRCYGTPSYYVQKLFSVNRGDAVLPTTVSSPAAVTNPPPRGAVGLGSWNTAVQYTNIVVTSNGVTLYQSDFVANGTSGWQVYQGNWSVNNGLYQQTSTSTTDCRSTTGDTNWANYTLSLRARKTGGSEGFLILFNWTDDNNWTWLNLGGWNNTLHGIEQNVNGSKSLLGSQVSGSIANNVWYDISVVVSNRQVQCYLNSNLVLEATYPITTSSSGVYVSSTHDHDSGEIILKAVNPNGVAIPTTFELNGLSSVASDATLIRLTSGSSADVNSLASPTNVSPVTSMIGTASTNFTLTLPANSLSVLRLTPGSIDTYTNLALQVPSPINTGTSVPCTVWGQKSGVWVDLTANVNHAITYESLDPAVAQVDSSGNVSGVGAGTAEIVARYGALSLASTQSVQVIYVPTALAHRYSFSETSGTNVADLIGGAAWDGTLPNGGTFGGGQLALAEAGQQYVDLPPFILSNYTNVTVEAWATFGTLPSACFLYGFGDKSGSLGVDYIFCQPRDGRIAITDGDWTSEQGTGGGGNWSGQSVHVTSVFNASAGVVALYTNGVLVSQNTTVTLAMSVVNNLFSYIARSLYSGDSYMDVTLDEFRIYDGALTADEVAASEMLGPDQVPSFLPPTIEASTDGSQLTLTWPEGNLGWILQSQTNELETGISAIWHDVAGSGLVTDTNFPISRTNPTVFYRLRKP